MDLPRHLSLATSTLWDSKRAYKTPEELGRTEGIFKRQSPEGVTVRNERGMEKNLFPIHYVPAVRLDLAQPLVGWWLTLHHDFPKRNHPFSISSKTGFAPFFSHHDLSLWQAAGWVSLTYLVLHKLLPPATKRWSCGRATLSFQRPQRAESAAAEQGKQSNTFPAAWSPPFQTDVTHGAITVQTSQKVTTHCT